MAKPAWVSTNPTSGTGNQTVNVSGLVHTGRSQRSGVLIFSAASVPDASATVNQTAKPEFVTIDNLSVPKGGGTATVTGKSNSSKLTFSLGSGDLTISLPGTYLAGGASTANGAAIAGDPGAVEEYNFSIAFTVSANATINALTKIVTVTANGGQSASATITQVAGDPTLSVDPILITLDASGAAVSVWTVPTRGFKGAHFATFPPDLIRTCIKAGCPPNGVVLDPFMGAGTTAVVARELGRNYVGIELNREYVRIAEERLGG